MEMSLSKLYTPNAMWNICTDSLFCVLAGGKCNEDHKGMCSSCGARLLAERMLIIFCYNI